MSLAVQHDVSLKPYNTFGIDVRASQLVDVESDQDARDALALAQQQRLPVLVIGGGSNLLLTADVQALVLRMASHGVRIVEDDGERVVVEAEAGEPWHPFVMQTLGMGLAGCPEWCCCGVAVVPGKALAGGLVDSLGWDPAEGRRLLVLI